jgi:hypothetical protein
VPIVASECDTIHRNLPGSNGPTAATWSEGRSALPYKRFNKHPEIWRYPGDREASKAIAWSAPLPFLTCAVFALACVQLHVYSYGATVKLAFEMWLIAPVPWIITTSLWMKLQPMIAAAYSLGWLVKLVLAAVSVASILW